jgi:V8-like Glu-specific endopeptidase
MKFLTTVTLSLFFSSALAAINSKDVIYGQDNRKDLYQVENPLQLKLASATAGMIQMSKFARTKAYGILALGSAPTLEIGQNVCASEAFSQQPIAATCSGFLVGPDTLVTAGHCYKSFDTPENVCKNFAWVFDYNMAAEDHDPTKNIPLKNIYLCKQIVAAKLDETLDYAVIKLDRKVVERTPLKYRTTGKIKKDASLLVIGHPSGLPTKISDGAIITRNNEPTRFSTTLDTFQGNSGSAVFDAKTGQLEGILIQGKSDYQLSIPDNEKSCKVVNQCDENGQNCSAGIDQGTVAYGEVVLRLSVVLKDINAALEL